MIEGNNQEINTLGLGATCLAWLDSFFHIMNPALQFILYGVSITWIILQIYYKIKSVKRID